MTTETLREAVARAICRELTGGWQASPKSIDHKAADAAIRTVLERLREHKLVVRDHEGMVAHELRGAPNDIWQAMLDAAVREVTGSDSSTPRP